MLLTKQVMALRHAVSDDDTREAMRGIHFDPVANVAQATDGRILVIQENPAAHNKEEDFPSSPGHTEQTPGIDKPIIINPKYLEKAFKNTYTAKNSSAPIRQCIRLAKNGVEGNAKVQATDLETFSEVTVKGIDSKYPDVDRVIPTAPLDTIFHLSVDMMEVMTKIAKDLTAVGVLFGIANNLRTGPYIQGPIVIRFSNAENNTSGVVMPMDFQNATAAAAETMIAKHSVMTCSVKKAMDALFAVLMGADDAVEDAKKLLEANGYFFDKDVDKQETETIQ